MVLFDAKIYKDIYRRGSDLSLRKIDATVRRETIYVAGWVVVLSVIMIAVFYAAGGFDWTVLTGVVLGGVTAILNFLLMGLTIQGAIGLEEKDARTRLKGSQNLRMLMQLLVAILGAVLPCFNMWAVLIPLFFPRIAVTIRSIYLKKT